MFQCPPALTAREAANYKQDDGVEFKPKDLVRNKEVTMSYLAPMVSEEDRSTAAKSGNAECLGMLGVAVLYPRWYVFSL